MVTIGVAIGRGARSFVLKIRPRTGPVTPSWTRLRDKGGTATTSVGDHAAMPRGANRVRVLLFDRPRFRRGRRECRVRASPMARQQIKKLAAVTTGSAGSSGIPCTMVLRLIARSPRGPGCLAPVAARFVTARLGLSVGRPGPHAFAVRLGAVRPHEKIVRAAKASIASPPHAS